MKQRDPDDPTPWQQIVALIGANLAIRLSERFGGTRIYIPARAGAHHPIVQVIGLPAAERLCAEFAAHSLLIPLREGKRSRILALAKLGWTRAAIAREVGCGERTVYYVLADQREPEEQLDLFG